MANYSITIEMKRPQGSMSRAGVWSASNLHTALARALTGIDPMERVRGPSHVGPADDKLAIGEKLVIIAERI